MKKDGIHPEFFPEAKVFCNGEEVMTVGGTKKEYVVDLWSGNHPYYQVLTGHTYGENRGNILFICSCDSTRLVRNHRMKARHKFMLRPDFVLHQEITCLTYCIMCVL